MAKNMQFITAPQGTLFSARIFVDNPAPARDTKKEDRTKRILLTTYCTEYFFSMKARLTKKHVKNSNTHVLLLCIDYYQWPNRVQQPARPVRGLPSRGHDTAHGTQPLVYTRGTAVSANSLVRRSREHATPLPPTTLHPTETSHTIMPPPTR